MRIIAAVTALSLCSCAAWFGWAEEPQEAPVPAGKVSPLMQMKLDKSKAILEGLTIEDYELISKNAQALHLLSRESGWNVLQTKRYTSESEDFRRAVEVIAEAAKEKDINRAALGYVAMTVRCVECHTYMRKVSSRSEDQ